RQAKTPCVRGWIPIHNRSGCAQRQSPVSGCDVPLPYEGWISVKRQEPRGPRLEGGHVQVALPQQTNHRKNSCDSLLSSNSLCRLRALLHKPVQEMEHYYRVCRLPASCRKIRGIQSLL